jgi:MoaA/NifB/PqqE/SkfB family radical SAM enzyme
MKYEHAIYYELKNFVAICSKYDRLFIYGDAERQRLLYKYCNICKINIAGFVTTDTVDKLKASDAVILGLSDKYYNEVYPILEKLGINRLIFLSEYSKQEIARKMRVLSAEETAVEVNLVDHCNLNCRSCDHFSPIAEPHFPSLREFERDIARLAELSKRHLGELYLLGGEPLLNQETPFFFEVARGRLPNTEISLFTNGILLMSHEADEVWKAARKNNVTIKITRYPIKLDMKAIYEKALKESVQIEIFQTHSMFTKYTLNASSGQTIYAFPECYQFNHCSVLKNGCIYMCPISAHIDKFNKRFGDKIAVKNEDFIDIHSANSFAEISEFLSVPTPFCQHCDIGSREVFEWGPSNRVESEYLGICNLTSI